MYCCMKFHNSNVTKGNKKKKSYIPVEYVNTKILPRPGWYSSTECRPSRVLFPLLRDKQGLRTARKHQRVRQHVPASKIHRDRPGRRPPPCPLPAPPDRISQTIYSLQPVGYEKAVEKPQEISSTTHCSVFGPAVVEKDGRVFLARWGWGGGG